MINRYRLFAAALFTVLLMLGFQTITPEKAAAQDAMEDCETAEVTTQAANIGDKQVVISAHGLFSHTGTWGIRGETSYEGSVHQTVDTIGSTWYYAFDYQSDNYRWVTDPDIGPKLAATIECFMWLSDEGGGNGTVFMIVHSMGGLALKYALEHVSTPEKVGVATIATPHAGSYLANVVSFGVDSICAPGGAAVSYTLRQFSEDYGCVVDELIDTPAWNGLQRGSALLDELPDFPKETVVTAIAGDITVDAVITPFWRVSLPEPFDFLHGDLIVEVNSALAQEEDDEYIASCHTDDNIRSALESTCWHSGLLRDPGVQQEVKSSIEAFIAANQPVPNEGVALDVFGMLSVPMDGINYEELDAEMSGLEYKIADTTECLGDDTCPYVSFIDTRGASGADVYQYMSMHGCMMDTGSGSAPPESIRQIGGKDVIFTESYNGYHNYTSYCWLGIEHGLSVLARAEGAVPFDPTRWQKAFDDEECEWL